MNILVPDDDDDDNKSWRITKFNPPPINVCHTNPIPPNRSRLNCHSLARILIPIDDDNNDDEKIY